MSAGFAEILYRCYGNQIGLRPVSRVDASGISTEKAQRLAGWAAKRSWRDHLDNHGRALDH